MESYEDIAQRYEKALKEGRELEGLTPVSARVPRNADSIYSIRFTSEEMTTVSGAAKAASLKLSQFIRQAALQIAASHQKEASTPSNAVLDERIKALEGRVAFLENLFTASNARTPVLFISSNVSSNASAETRPQFIGDSEIAVGTPSTSFALPAGHVAPTIFGETQARPRRRTSHG